MTNLTLNQLLENLPGAVWQKIAEIDGLKGQWMGGAKLNPQVLGRLKKSVLVTSTGASTRIEGARLSDEDIEKLMRGISIKQFADRDKQEVRGYFGLLNNVFDSWKQLHFSENLIKHFHQELLKFVDKDQLHRGEYKKQENKVHMINEVVQWVGFFFDTPPAYLTPTAMTELVEATIESLKSAKHHPLVVIGNFIVQFLQIHPFQDGNGRLSRILTNLLLLQAGYAYIPYISHEKIIEDNKPDYYMALRKSQKTFATKNPSITPWLHFFLDVVLEQSKQAIGLLTAENLVKLLSPSQLKVWEYLQEVGEATPMDIAGKLNIPRPTINQVMDRLLDLKKVERLGQGRAVRYKVL